MDFIFRTASGITLPTPSNWYGDIPSPGNHFIIDRYFYKVISVDSQPEKVLVWLEQRCPSWAPEAKKDTNPKDAVGTAKAPLSTVSAPFMHAVGLAMMEGARKYGRHNYRVAGIRYSVYYDAAMRHLTAWWEGEDIDPDSGLPHPVKAAACMAVLFDAMMQENGTDDRPPKSPEGWQAEMNKMAAGMIKRHPNAVDPCTEK